MRKRDAYAGQGVHRGSGEEKGANVVRHCEMRGVPRQGWGDENGEG